MKAVARLSRHLGYTGRRLRRSLREALVAGLDRHVEPRLAPGVWEALNRLALELRIARTHRRAVRRVRAGGLPIPLRLNLGSGPNPKPGWLDVDLQGDALHLDLRRTLPFADMSVAEIYSEHFFEHLGFPGEARQHLAECFRVLVQGGRLALAVPDAEQVLRAYATRDEEHFRRAGELWHPDWCRSPLDHVNYTFRQDGEHKWAWDEESLVRELVEAGFVAVRRRDYEPELDSERRRGGLLVEGRRPEH